MSQANVVVIGEDFGDDHVVAGSGKAGDQLVDLCGALVSGMKGVGPNGPELGLSRRRSRPGGSGRAPRRRDAARGGQLGQDRSETPSRRGGVLYRHDPRPAAADALRPVGREEAKAQAVV